VKAVVFAYHDMGLVGLDALKRASFEVEAVFSHLDDSRERCWFGSVVEWSKNEGIPFFCPENVNTTVWIDLIKAMAPDVIFSFYYRSLISNDILAIPAGGAYNLHGSLLPAYRGRCPVNWVLIHGEEKTGVTLHHMVAKPDAGDIVGQKEVAIAFDDTAKILFAKLCSAARELLDGTLPLIKTGNAKRIPQNLDSGSYFGGRRPEDGKIDWGHPAMKIYNLVRAVTEPYPGAFAILPGGEKILVWWVHPVDERFDDRKPGSIIIQERAVFVATGRGVLRLLDIEIGGRRMKDEEIYEYFNERQGVILA
jgi:methionyl-tRNA formyltransferase